MKMLTKLRLITTGFAALAAATTVLALPGAPARASIAPVGILHFVAVGDSYASGEGDKGGLPWLDPTCERSQFAAPQQAASLFSSDTGRTVAFDSYACQGATIEDLLATPNGQLAQVDANHNDPVDALSISIGGNDLQFADIVQDCVYGNPCNTDAYSTGLVATGFAKLEGTPQHQGLLADLVQTVNGMHDVDNVFVTEYPDPTTGPNGWCGLGGLDPGFEGFGLFTQPEAQWASTSIITPLNNDLANMVTMGEDAPGPHPAWHLVSGMSAAFDGHGFCTGGLSPNPADWFTPRYFDTPIDSMTSQNDHLGSMHPNDLGQQAIAGIMEAAYQSAPTLSASVSESSMPVAQAPSNFNVQATTFAGAAVAGATVLVDGSAVGYTGANGYYTFSNYVFPTSGYHTITVQTNSDEYGETDLVVAPRPVRAASNPSPIPAKTVIPSLALTASDGLNGQFVAGTFTLTSGAGTWTVPSGGSAANVEVTILGWQTEGVPGPDGKPIVIKVPICPTLTFQPGNSLYSNENFSSMLTCKPL